MATFKAVVLSHHKKDDGTYNVKIRVTHKRKVRYLPTPFYIESSQMTRGLRIKDQSINDKIDEKIKELREACLSIGFITNDMDVDQLVDALSIRADKMDFIQFAKGYVEELRKNGRTKTADSYSTAINSLSLFNKEKPLYFSLISKQYMYQYFCSLSKLAQNTRHNYIVAIKTIYNEAIKRLNDEDENIIIAKYGVFKLIDIPNIQANKSNVLTRRQMQAVIDSPYDGNASYDMAKDLYIFSFVCFGINYADIKRLEKSQYKDGILTYIRKKTEARTSEPMEMKVEIPPIAQKIIKKYSGDKKYLFDFRGLKRGSDCARRIHAAFQNAGIEKKYDNYLAKAGHIKGKYTFYSARHTMASLARNECGVDFMVVHEMLNHAVPREFKTTDTYIIKDYSNIWEANKKLLALFDWSKYEQMLDESISKRRTPSY